MVAGPRLDDGDDWCATQWEEVLALEGKSDLASGSHRCIAWRVSDWHVRRALRRQRLLISGRPFVRGGAGLRFLPTATVERKSRVCSSDALRVLGISGFAGKFARRVPACVNESTPRSHSIPLDPSLSLSPTLFSSVLVPRAAQRRAVPPSVYLIVSGGGAVFSWRDE